MVKLIKEGNQAQVRASHKHRICCKFRRAAEQGMAVDLAVNCSPEGVAKWWWARNLVP